jgi:hypothetical protein
MQNKILQQIRDFFLYLGKDWLANMRGALSVFFTAFGILDVWSRKDLFYVLAILALTVSGCSTPEISGTVTGAVSSGVSITLSGDKSASTTTDYSGKYSFTGLENGNYTVTPSLTGYTFNSTSTTVSIVNNNDQVANFTATAGASSSV